MTRPDAPAAPFAPAAERVAPSERGSRIASQAAVRGEFSADGDLVLQGSFQGSIKLSSGTLWVEEGASVEAELVAAHVHVQGRIKGNIRATGKVVLGPRAVMKGDIVAGHIQISEGAKFSGAVKMGEEPPA